MKSYQIYCSDLDEVKFVDYDMLTPLGGKESWVDIWISNINAEYEDSAFLNHDERRRAGKFKFDHLKNNYIYCRSTLRKILASYIGEAPPEIQIKYMENGKPFLVSDSKKLDFNLSHSGDKLIVACSNKSIGADIEYINPKFDYQSVSNNFFTENEIIEIGNQDQAMARLALFFKYWTRKEAILKETGIGLSKNLKKVSVLNGHNEYPMDNHEVDKVVKSDYHLISFMVSESYPASIALKESVRKIKFLRTDRLE
ncbi:4'-phosphopantetheinyl transferase superfamily protein [Fulvivirgaceae bacterium BMA10]|uniref:4'-phosphopantetheinyl transferase superfamily protein n=1 Tax=Splendidivirga corallicola TaxID=3051826 RepID=A0ABT8KU18_9BACT|nr:4'-phosphopantetheinyl transferase superfamily protein [Fulvivirgaceae bacterium BMA10]